MKDFKEWHLIKDALENKTYRTLAEKFNDVVGNKIFEIVPVENWPEEEYVAVGEFMKGRDFIRQIFSLAKKEIFIFDNYLCDNIIVLLEEIILGDLTSQLR